ncbi:hypothetical protein MNBD_NITROSPINAE02-2180 [hydrothermal vent metagenome]|uniref:FAD/NAD(P)-binding domain-containing protein n=1 Tax=hydrothermal vent metagenome TaxID=652676 RepID=A0A3B1BZ67_9ZZZZ
MKNYVIIGSGVAGISAADEIRRLDPSGRITIFNGEPYPYYFRAALSFYFKGEISEEELQGKPAGWAKDNRIRIMNDRVKEIRVNEKEVVGESMVCEPFDKLLIATGAWPFTLPWPGVDLEGVFTYRGVVCARNKRDFVKKRGVKTSVVIGGGILGIEMAENFQNLGIKTCIIDRADRILPLLFDETGSSIIKDQFESDGVRVLPKVEVTEFVGEDQKLTGVTLNNGETIQADMVIVSVGSRPYVDFLADSGIELDRGVVVDENLRTNCADIYSAGDVAVQKIDGALVPCRTWLTAAHMGVRAGANMAGPEAPFLEKVFFNASHAYRSIYAIVGRFNAEEGNAVRALSQKTGKEKYQKIFIEGDKVIGGAFINDVYPAWQVYRAIEHDVRLDSDALKKAKTPADILNAIPHLPQLLY